MIAKVFSILLFVLPAFAAKGTTSDTLVVIFDRQNFVQGDSIEMEVYSEPFKSNQPAQTLHLWIDNVETGKRWKYRYPFLKGRCKFFLKISDSIANGTYAFNFLLQKKFLAVKGKLKNATDQGKEINYLARARNKPPIIGGAAMQPGGEFEINDLYFTDSLFFGFSPVQKSKDNNLKIALETPIDSTFTPEAFITEFISIGQQGNTKPGIEKGKGSYLFVIEGEGNTKLLKEVSVKTKVKKQIDEYKDRYVSGLFGNEDARTLDLLDSDEALSYSDLYTYLTVKFPGLVQRNNQLYYRNEPVDIYVDEFNDAGNNIHLQDVAMVKFFSQSFRLGGGLNDDGFGGSIAIYTKRPENKQSNKLSNYSFYVKGYTQKNAEWK